LDPNALNLQVSAQNRGTENLAGMQLNVQINGANQSFYFSNVRVGQTVSQSVPIPIDSLQKNRSVSVNSSVEIPGIQDSNSKNNTKNSILHVQH